MADGTEEQNSDLDEEEETEDESTEESGEESTEESKAAESKRIRDLQSKADKAEARANKAEAALAKAGKRDEGKPAEGSQDPELAATRAELREASLDAVYAEFEQLKSYGIDRSLIEGSTRAEMREAATQLVGLIKSVETKARNRTLKEHGIVAEPAGATRTPPKSYDEMSAEDFEKEITRAKSGGAAIW